MRLSLTVTGGPHTGQVFTFDGHDTFIVGRSKKAHFRLKTKDKLISRLHFLMEVNPPLCRLFDLGSRNKTYLNDREVQSAEVHDGDQIKIGRTFLRVSLQGATPEIVRDKESTVQEVPPTLLQGESVRPETPMVDPSGSLPALPPASGPDGGRCPFCPLEKPLPAPGVDEAPWPAGASPCPSCREEIRKQPQPVVGYRIVRQLGQGAMGTVHLAVRTQDLAPLALKTIRPNVVADRDLVERFLREASILRELQHPHIVPFQEMGECDGLLFFAMDYVRGADAARLQKDLAGPMAVSRAVGWVCQLLQALEYAHARGFVHRDIKPANMLVSVHGGQEVVRLVDFGLARMYQASRMSGLTLQGEVGGTVSFMAPEQVTHFREAKPAADQYSAAATLYTLLTNKYLFDFPRQNFQRQLLMILEDEPVPIRERRPDLPGELASAVHTALAKKPEARFADVTLFRQALLPYCQ